MSTPSIAGQSRTDASSTDAHAFATFIASRANRADARNQDDRDRRKRYRLALIVSVVIHGVLYLAVRQWSLLPHDDTVESTVIQLRLIDDPSALPPKDDVIVAASADARAKQETLSDRPVMPLPMPTTPAPSTAASVTASVPARIPETAQSTDVGVNAMAEILDREGRVVLPATVDDPAVFGSRKPAPDFVPNPMAHESPLPYKATPFDRYWKPDGETLLGEWVRKASKEASYDTKYGTRISCKAFLFMMACGWGPTPRVSIEALKAMRVDPPAPRNSADDPYLPPIP